MIATRLRRVLRHFGLDVIRAKPMLTDLMQVHRIDTVLDVGANEGGYGEYLRRWGFDGWIVSFEPISAAFAQLDRRAQRDPRWTVRNEGLASSDGETMINISEFSVFSSILEPTSVAMDFDRRVRTVRREKVRIRRLDSIWEEVRSRGSRFYLKVDTQGSEPEVIRGAEGCLSAFTAVQLELSLRPMYQGEVLLTDMMRMMAERGFDLVFTQPVVYDPRDLSVLQLDCVFVRRHADTPGN